MLQSVARNLWVLIAFMLVFSDCPAQEIKGQLQQFTIHAATLANKGGESQDRKVTVYLPPGYASSGKRYPVIYYLHGFMGTDSIYPAMKDILDLAISKHKIRPFILVQSNQYTEFEGSFYSNSALTGNWEDFTALELVNYIDTHFRTIAQPSGRGIAGHSMGGYGAFKIGMLHPEVFSVVYALSPGLLAFVKEFGPNSDSFKELQSVQTREALKKTYYPKVLVAVGRAWSPNPNKPPFYADFPFTYEKDSIVIHQDVLEKWRAQMPVYMVHQHQAKLRQLKAIKLDWGRNDAQRFPIQCGMLSQALENLGIRHYAEEYIGNHGNMIWTTDGRVLNSLLPFFDDHLLFQ